MFNSLDERLNAEEWRGQDQKLLWVNKNVRSGTLSRSDNAETHLILSHVRNRRRQHGGGSQPWKAFTSCLEMQNDSDGGATTTLSPVSRVSNGRPIPTNIVRPRLHQVLDMRRPISMSQAVNQSKLLLRHPCYNSSDPFHSTVLGIDATMSMSVISNSVSSRISRVTFLAEALAPPHFVAQTTHDRHDRFRDERLKACVDSELLMCSSIAHGSSGLAWVSGSIGDEERSQYFVSKTLTAVRATLSRNDASLNKSLVLSIYTLACTELWNAIPDMWLDNPYIVRPTHFQACKTHLTALVVLIESAGGWSVVTPYILEGILLVDKYTAMYSMSKPIVPLTWGPDAASPDPRVLWDCTTRSGSRPGSGFGSSSVKLELQDILQSMGTFLHAAARAWRLSPSLGPSTESWLYLKLHTFYYRILLYEHQTELEYAIKLAALISQLNLVAYAGATMFTPLLLARLRISLKRCWTKFIHTDPDLRLWCLCTGVLTKRSTPEKPWFVKQLAEVIRDCSIPPHLDELSGRLEAYIYVSARQDQELSMILTALHN